jgi:long-chain acyl-CoA synthetase
MYAQKPWLKHYESHVPEHLDYPQTTLPVALAKTAAQNPDQPVIIFKDRQLTYGQFDDAVNRFAAALQGLGVGKGSLVAIHLPNCPQFPIAYFAVLRLGAIVVPCNPVYTAREMIHQLNDSGATVIITLSNTYPLIKQIRSQTALQHVVVAKIKSYFPPLLRLLYTVAAEKKSGHRVSIAGDVDTHWFQDLLKGGPAKPAPVDISGDDTAVLMYTGGTTGLSKGAQLTHHNILVNAYQVRVWADISQRPARVLAALPLFHSYGMTCCMNPAALGLGTMILVPDPRDVTDILKTIQKQRPQMYPGVPALYVAIINHPDVGNYDLSCLEFCNSGAAPLPVEVQQRFQELTGARLVEGYGLSEASPVTHGNPAYGDSRIGTIGLPWPDTEAKIVDVESGEQLQAVGQPGELCIRGPQVMKGYWKMPTETANTLRPDPDGGGPWLHTGDVGTMDEDGYFRIVDRVKDMILGAGGFNIYPREIEEVLFQHPQVLEAAAVGVPVEGKGERVKVFVVLKPGQSASEADIIEFCRQNLAPHKVPSFVEFREELPKSQVGKVLRRELEKNP